jgi:hypothetical protein
MTSHSGRADESAPLTGQVVSCPWSLLPIYHSHRPIRITRTGDGFVRSDLIDTRQIFVGKSNFKRADIFLQIFASTPSLRKLSSQALWT